jgi:hypothetical protein
MLDRPARSLSAGAIRERRRLQQRRWQRAYLVWLTSPSLPRQWATQSVTMLNTANDRAALTLS